MAYLMPTDTRTPTFTSTESRGWVTTHQVNPGSYTVYGGIIMTDSPKRVAVVTCSYLPYSYNWYTVRNPGNSNQGSLSFNTLNSFGIYGNDAETLGWYPTDSDTFTITSIETYIPVYTSIEDFYADIGVLNKPITYRLTNATGVNNPTEARIGSIVTCNFSFPEGYGIVNPTTDIYVTNNGVLVPSSYSNGVLSFTMPDPS